VGDELLEWYERVQDVTGIYDPPNLERVGAGYLDIDASRLEMLRSKYDFDYVVLIKGQKYDFLDSYRQAYENDGFLVLDLSNGTDSASEVSN
jgi:hypothetical protein